MNQIAYPAPLADLLQQMPLAPLGPGRPDQSFRSRLETAWQGPVKNRDMAAACRAGLYLGFNFLDESHTISQALHTAEGSYWHALMHRREPDFPNAAYWFRRVGVHPVYEPLRQEAARLAADGSFLATQKSWGPFAFVDLCEASYEEGSADHELCRQIQRIEWELLFRYCYDRAIA